MLIIYAHDPRSLLLASERISANVEMHRTDFGHRTWCGILDCESTTASLFSITKLSRNSFPFNSKASIINSFNIIPSCTDIDGPSIVDYDIYTDTFYVPLHAIIEQCWDSVNVMDFSVEFDHDLEVSFAFDGVYNNDSIRVVTEDERDEASQILQSVFARDIKYSVLLEPFTSLVQLANSSVITDYLEAFKEYVDETKERIDLLGNLNEMSIVETVNSDCTLFLDGLSSLLDDYEGFFPVDISSITSDALQCFVDINSLWFDHNMGYIPSFSDAIEDMNAHTIMFLHSCLLLKVLSILDIVEVISDEGWDESAESGSDNGRISLMKGIESDIRRNGFIYNTYVMSPAADFFDLFSFWNNTETLNQDHMHGYLHTIINMIKDDLELCFNDLNEAIFFNDMSATWCYLTAKNPTSIDFLFMHLLMISPPASILEYVGVDVDWTTLGKVTDDHFLTAHGECQFGLLRSGLFALTINEEVEIVQEPCELLGDETKTSWDEAEEHELDLNPFSILSHPHFVGVEYANFSCMGSAGVLATLPGGETAYSYPSIYQGIYAAQGFLSPPIDDTQHSYSSAGQCSATDMLYLAADREVSSTKNSFVVSSLLDLSETP
ncbi:hypothetical protein ADUPG1_008247, partial [Aduncisulcus paluster]